LKLKRDFTADHIKSIYFTSDYPYSTSKLYSIFFIFICIKKECTFVGYHGRFIHHDVTGSTSVKVKVQLIPEMKANTVP